jgi:S-adenosylmethionine:tRNA ribosyltransferase-isomerase
LRVGDILVVNETRVLPARLALHKATGGAAEVFLLEQPDPADPMRWLALVRPGRRLPPGTVLGAADGTPVVEVGETQGPDGERVVRLLTDPTAHGAVPLPPYIHEPLADPDRYQTVYARTPGSVAAPTAGLHLTTELLDELRAAGVDVHTVDLKVGLGTFKPITADRIGDHVMHEERYAVPAATLEACRRATGRVVAVGTTTVRALESAASTGELEGRTDLFITPGFDFQLVDVLLTNFHQPRSSLLVLLSAFAGQARWRRLYELALAEGYRFLSFGDAMLISRAC